MSESAPSPKPGDATIPLPTAAPPNSTPAAESGVASAGRLAGWIDVRLLATALVLTVMSWPIRTLGVEAGLDPAWRTALHMAVHDGLAFGRDVSFTYGPLGFLREPQVAYAWLGRLSFAYTAFLQAALCLTLLWALRRNFGSLLFAAPLAYLIAQLAVEEPAPVLVFAVVVGLVRGEFPRRLLPWLVAATGALTGIQLLGKLNVGIILLALSCIALSAIPAGRWRAAGWFASGLLVALIGGWVLTGQPIGAVAEYVRSSMQIIAGYSAAMTVDDPSGNWQLWTAFLLAAVGWAIALRGDPLASLRGRATIAVLWTVLSFTAFKSGFVRHDAGHAPIFFATALGGFAALPLSRLPRATAALVLLVAAVAFFGARGGAPSDYITPVAQARAFVEQARVLANPSTTNAWIVAGRARLVAAYALDPQSLAAIDGQTVHLDPYETNIAYAYRLRWAPIPVFQSYSAYTPYLDELNAAALSAPAGPGRVLRHAVPAVDGRNPTWESPAAARAMLCNFRAISTNASWQVLARVPDRCGQPRPLGISRGRLGQSVRIPPAPDRRSAVYAVLDGVGVHGAERLINLLYRADQRTLTLDGTRPYRLVPGTATDGLLLRVPRRVDFAPPFELDQQAEQLAVTRGAGAQSGGEFRVRWYAIALR